MRTQFSYQLGELHTSLIRMGSWCEAAIDVVARAMEQCDKEAMQKLRPLEEEIDRMERQIEALCLKLILQQQPVAGDLRNITAALKMISDLERIGDQCADISELLEELSGPLKDVQAPLITMAETAKLMVKDAVEAFVQEDVDRAYRVVAQDAQVDDGFEAMKSQLGLWCCGEREDLDEALNLLMIAKYLERIGDHAANVAEWVIYAVTGSHRMMLEDYFGTAQEGPSKDEGGGA